MSKIPKTPQEIFPEIIADYKKIFGADLVSIVLYGSGTGGDYLPGKSDINFLMILSQNAGPSLDRALETVKKWRQRLVAIPLFMTKPFILSSVDSYPIEFFNMQSNHTVVFGADILNDLVFDPGHLRLQLERELKGKILHLQTGFLETDGKPKRIRQLIEVSFKAFLAFFKAMLFLKNKTIPEDRYQVIETTAKAFSIDAGIFLQCAALREDSKPYSSEEISKIFHLYLQEIHKLSDIIDRMMEDHEI
ncbi:MAG: hypothetical protein JXA41_05780 [Deltaproteobacteria bacterium]|nr:hypothetical protein [Deltaproteobacteria bacterium]